MLRDEFDDTALGLGGVALGLELRHFGSRCHRYSQDTHHHYFCERVLMFCHSHEAITTPSPLPGQAALREESGCSPLVGHCPGISRPRSSVPSTIIAAGLGSRGKLTRHVAVSDLLSLCLSQCWTAALHSGWAAARRRRSVVIIAAGRSRQTYFTFGSSISTVEVCSSSRGRRAQRQLVEVPEDPGRPHRSRLVPRHAGPVIL